MQFYNLSHCYSKGLQKGIVTLLTWVFLLFFYQVQQKHNSETKQAVTWGNIERTSALIISYLALISSHPFIIFRLFVRVKHLQSPALS